MNDPNPTLGGFALNNLGVASWFHKAAPFPIVPSDFNKHLENDKRYGFSQIDQDFKFVEDLLKQSIQSIEYVQKNQLSEFAEEEEEQEAAKEPKNKLSDEQVRNMLLSTSRKGKMPKEEEDILDPSKRMVLNKKKSGVPLMNLGEFLLQTQPEGQSVKQ